MNRPVEDARKRARDIRDEALARHAERDRASLAALASDLAELKAMALRQQEQLARLTAMVAELSSRPAAPESLDSGHASSPRPLSARKRVALERIRDLRAQDISFSRICEIFQTEGQPTLSGQGQWSKGTLWNLWKNHAHQLDSSPK
jgi:chromosome condensin MukBEF ATPase and DNA-binding subunit MukB